MTETSVSDITSTSASLAAFFSGETGTISETGFEYGTVSGNLTESVKAIGTTSPIAGALTGLTPNTAYYCRGYVKEYDENISGYEKIVGPEASFRTQAIATATVANGEATGLSSSGATLIGSYSGATGNVTEYGFYYGTSADATNTKVTTSSTSGSSFTKILTGLNANTTYYYKAYIREFNESLSATEERLASSVLSFTTLASSQPSSSLPGYLGCYEIPAVSLANSAAPTSYGKETFGDTNWYEHDASVSTLKIVTHTYAYNDKVYRNYTAMIDQNKRCALWTAYPMHSTAYPSTGVGRDGSFNENTSYDPAIPREWQSSGSTSDYSNGNGYARGHHCASSDRQATDAANNQTFYYTNQSPQWQNNFNSGVWSSLEARVQNQAPTGRDTLYVVVGTLFENGNSGSSNDGGTVARPSHFYKCIMKCSFDTSGSLTAASGIAFIYTNEAHSGVNYYDSDFVTSIDAIETRAGFDFFANVPTSLQNSAESNTNHTWFTGQSSPSNVASVGDNNWGSL